MEEKSSTKHEYINGEIYDMAGASDTHVTIAGNLFVFLRNNLRGSGCRVYISDMKLQVKQRNCYYYPDIFVTCESKDRESSNYKQFPKLIIEVLSDSTEAFDRGDKFADYQTVESLQEYVLINTKRQRIESFRRSNDNLWTLQNYTPETEDFELSSIGFTGNFKSIYEDVNFG